MLVGAFASAWLVGPFHDPRIPETRFYLTGPTYAAIPHMFGPQDEFIVRKDIQNSKMSH